MTSKDLPKGVTPGTATSPPSAECPHGDWRNDRANNNADAAAGLAKHLRRVHGEAS